MPLVLIQKKYHGKSRPKKSWSPPGRQEATKGGNGQTLPGHKSLFGRFVLQLRTISELFHQNKQNSHEPVTSQDPVTSQGPLFKPRLPGNHAFHTGSYFICSPTFAKCSIEFYMGLYQHNTRKQGTEATIDSPTSPTKPNLTITTPNLIGALGLVLNFLSVKSCQN